MVGKLTISARNRLRPVAFGTARTGTGCGRRSETRGTLKELRLSRSRRRAGGGRIEEAPASPWVSQVRGIEGWAGEVLNNEQKGGVQVEERKRIPIYILPSQLLEIERIVFKKKMDGERRNNRPYSKTAFFEEAVELKLALEKGKLKIVREEEEG